MSNNHYDQLNVISSSLGAISRIFYAVYYIDLNQKTIQELHSEVEQVRSAVGDFGDADTIINILCSELVLPDYRDRISDFTNLDTLTERLEGKKYISCDYEGRFSGWSEAIFADADRNADGTIHHAVFMVREIAERKKNELQTTRYLLNSYESTKSELEFQQMAISSIQKTIKSAFWSMVLDGNFRTVRCSFSNSFRKLLGYDEEDSIPEIAQFFTDVMSDEDSDKASPEALMKIAAEKGEADYDAEYRMRTKKGKLKWVRSVGRVSVNEDGNYVIFGLITDINKQKKAEKMLEAEKKRSEEQSVVLQAMADFYLTMHLIDLNDDTFIEYNSHKYISRWTDAGTKASEMIRTVMQNNASEEYRQRMIDFVNFDTLAERINNRKLLACEFIGVHFGWVKAEFKAVSRNDDGTPAKVIFTTLVIDDEKKKEEELIYESCTDTLTQVYNRRAYEDDFEMYDSGSDNPELAVIAFDLNGLKEVNDTLGHQAGDELIRGAADCLKKIYSSYGKIYRIGGDEFTAIINAEPDTLEELNEDFEIACTQWESRKYQELELSISAGQALREDNPDLPVIELARIADKNMYEAKARYYKNNGLDRRKVVLF